MGHSSRGFARIAAMSVMVTVVHPCFGSAGAAEIITLQGADETSRTLSHDPSRLGREKQRLLHSRDLDQAGAASANRVPFAREAYAGTDLGGPFGGAFDNGILPPPPPQQPPFAPPLAPPALPPFVGLPPQPPACPLIIEVGRGLRHAARTRIISGHAFCR